MTSARAERDLEARARLFKALGSPGRLLILNLIERKPRCGDELAEILRLKPATVSHHLSALEKAGLLASRKDQYYRVFTLEQQLFGKTLRELVLMPQPELGAHLEEDAFKSKVMRAFMREGRLERLPAQLKKRLVILEHLVEEFELDTEYTELEVNRILVEFNEDVAALRRALIDHRLMKRKSGIYRRLVE